MKGIINKEEFMEFLEKHNVDYDPRFIWD